MSNCVDIFGQAIMQRNYEHMQKKERTIEVLLTEYAVANTCFLIFDAFFFLQSKIKPAAVVLPNNFAR